MDDVISHAASVIAARDGARGLEVLVIERGAGQRFLPGYVAFPGGKVDVEDEEHALRWFGTREEAARACAIRELLEELGLALTADGPRPARPGALDPIDAAPPMAEQLQRIARWVAPPDVPVRFDALYFAVAAGPGVEPSPDGEETAHAWWESPPTLLEAWRAGERKLYWPTFFTVQALARCRDVAELFALQLDTREPDEDELALLPRSTFWQE